MAKLTHLLTNAAKDAFPRSRPGSCMRPLEIVPPRGWLPVRSAKGRCWLRRCVPEAYAAFPIGM